MLFTLVLMIWLIGVHVRPMKYWLRIMCQKVWSKIIFPTLKLREIRGISMFTLHENTTQSMKKEKDFCWWCCHQGYPSFGFKAQDLLEKASFRNCGECGWKLWAFNRQKGCFVISDLIAQGGSILRPSMCPVPTNTWYCMYFADWYKAMPRHILYQTIRRTQVLMEYGKFFFSVI